MSATVHPHLPRLSQAVTGVLTLEALLFGDPIVVLVALGLVLVALLAPRWSPVHWFFRRIARPAEDLEPVAPVRFSQTLAAVALASASVLLFAGAETAGWVIVGAVSAMALFSAASGFCVGCAVYRVAMARSGDRDGDVRAALGLEGAGPWLVVVTAPGCARCEPVARRLEDMADGRPVVRVDLSRTPAAARLPVTSVPAVVAVDADGRVRRAHAGRLDQVALREALAAV
jgi:hypothetical protein